MSSKLENTRLPSDKITGASAGHPHAMESPGLSPGSSESVTRDTSWEAGIFISSRPTVRILAFF